MTEPHLLPASADQEAPGDPDQSTARSARVYNYWLGGEDNFPADRAVGDAVMRKLPQTRKLVRGNREFLRRAVHFICREGISQIVDLGAGFPSPRPTVDEIARKYDPGSAIAYVDHDPVVVERWRGARTDDRIKAVQGDVREPRDILAHPDICELIDWDRPAGVLCVAVFPFIHGDIAEMADAFRSRMAPGSYLAVSHLTTTGTSPDALAHILGSYEGEDEAKPVFRDASEIERVFGGWPLVQPGLVDITEWRPPAAPWEPSIVQCLAGVAQAP